MQRVSQPTHAKSRRSRRAKKSAGGAVSAQNANDNCWNSQHGCTFTGDSTSLARHLEQECRFHEITCAVCIVRVLQMDISKHLWQDCFKSAEAAGGAAAVSVSAGSSSRPLSAATVSPGDSPLTVGDVDRAFKQLKEMFSSLTVQQIAIVETRVNELSENVASLEAKLVDVDASEQSDTTEEELLDSVMPKLGDIEEEIVTLRTAVWQSTDTAVTMTGKLHEQVRRCAQNEKLNLLVRSVNELEEDVYRNNAQLMRNTADIQDRCELLAQESTVHDLQSQLKGLIENFCSFEFKFKAGVALILVVVRPDPFAVLFILAAAGFALKALINKVSALCNENAQPRTTPNFDRREQLTGQRQRFPVARQEMMEVLAPPPLTVRAAWLAQ
ncbi:uncharacterized protein LOC144159194 isoform X1 [Haemaphysalis longicornis]